MITKRFRQVFFLNSKSGGFSIIEVLVGFGLLAILSIAMANMISNQNKEFKAIEEKFALQNLETQVAGLVGNNEYCKCFLKSAIFDSSPIKKFTDFPTEIHAAYDSGCSPLGTSVLKVGEIKGNFKAQSITVPNNTIAEVAAGSGFYTGKMEIKIDAANLMRSRKPIIVNLTFKTKLSDPSKVESCSTSSNELQLNNITQLPMLLIKKQSFGRQSTLRNQFKLCFLSYVQSGGNNGTGQPGGLTTADDKGMKDHCKVDYDSAIKVWTLYGERGDDPDINCRMTCIP